MRVDKLIFSPIEVNTYIISDNDGIAAIVDCGCYSRDEFERLKNFLYENKLKPAVLLNTHLHLDHIFGNHFVLENYGLKTRADEKEKPNLLSAPLHAEMFGLSMPEPPGPGEYITGGQTVRAGDIKLRCISVPGHTAGSIAYYCEEAGFVLSGDALFAEGIGRTDLPGGDYDMLISSIKENLLSLPDDTRVCPGHGPETSVGYEKMNNPFLK